MERPLHPSSLALHSTMTRSSVSAAETSLKPRPRVTSAIFSLPQWSTRHSATSESQSIEARSYNSSSLCPVCLRDFNGGNMRKLECQHRFHTDCLKNVSSPLTSDISSEIVLSVEALVSQRNPSSKGSLDLGNRKREESNQPSTRIAGLQGQRSVLAPPSVEFPPRFSIQLPQSRQS